MKYPNVRATPAGNFEGSCPSGRKKIHLGTFSTAEEANYHVLTAQAKNFKIKAAEYRGKAKSPKSGQIPEAQQGSGFSEWFEAQKNSQYNHFFRDAEKRNKKTAREARKELARALQGNSIEN